MQAENSRLLNKKGSPLPGLRATRMTSSISASLRLSPLPVCAPTLGTCILLWGESPLLQHVVQRGEHVVGPDLVAFGVGVEGVGHDVFGEVAIGIEEFGAEFEEDDFLAVGEAGVGFGDFGGLFAEAVIGLGAA